MKTPANPNAHRRRQSYIDAMESFGHTPHVISVDGDGWGFEEIGRLILARARHAAQAIDAIEGCSVDLSRPFFKEFVVNFDGTGRRVADINAALRRQRIFGGLDLSGRFPKLGQSALYCVTEIHAETDIRRLADTLQEICT